METQVENNHIPVLLEPILEFLKDKNQAKTNNSNLKIYDGTFGGGSYSKAFLDPGYHVWACDLDSIATIIASTFKQKYQTTFNFKTANFKDYIAEFEDNFFDSVVVDLGFSTNQLDFSGRGFSYSNGIDDNLDLRYNSDSGLACYELILKCKSKDELGKILYQNSGENLSFRLAGTLFELFTNTKNPEKITVGQVVQNLERAIPAKFYKKSKAILSRIWQALRIWTNAEFEVLQEFLNNSLSKLAPGGMLVIVSFHSLEDKIVAQFMRQSCKPINEDVYGNKEYKYKLLTPKFISPTEQELLDNPRSRSGRLRILQRL